VNLRRSGGQRGLEREREKEKKKKRNVLREEKERKKE